MKDALQSKTIIAALIGILSIVLELFGINISIADPTNPTLNEIIAIITGVIAIYGRLSASTKIQSVAGVKLKGDK